MEAYGIDPQSVKFKSSERGQNGYFIGYLNGDRNNEIGVVNDVGYNSTELGNMNFTDKRVYGGTFSRYGGLPTGERRDGKRVIVDSYSPYRNYTASDISNPLAMIAIQVHELGHSLSLLTKKYPYTDPYSPVEANHQADGGTYFRKMCFWSGGRVKWAAL